MARNDQAKYHKWTQLIKGWETSGLTQRTYCAQKGLKHSTFDYWRRQIGHTPSVSESALTSIEAKRLTLVPVQFSAERSAECPTERPAEKILVRSPAGWQFELSTAIDAAWLAKFLHQMP